MEELKPNEMDQKEKLISQILLEKKLNEFFFLKPLL
jgi:hypothetical protein